MPTRVDVAATAAHKEISNVVERIETNLAAAQSSPSSQDVSSPLFRDEVQRQEMRYLDRLLLGDGHMSQRKEGTATGGNQCKGSKIASILSPYDRRDDDGESRTPSGNTQNKHSPKRSSSQKPRNKHPIENNLPNQNDSFGHKIHDKISTFIRINQPPKKKPAANNHQKRTRAAVPSRNKRQQRNQKLIQRAQLSTRKVINKVVRLGRRCTRNLTTIKNYVHLTVAHAMANAHSMLEETCHGHSPISSARRHINLNGNPNRKRKPDSLGSTGSMKTSAKQSTAANASLRDNSTVRIPPMDAFSFTAAPTKWVLGGKEYMSSKAVLMAKKTIQNNKREKV